MPSFNSNDVQGIRVRRHPYSYQTRIIKLLGIYFFIIGFSFVIELLTNNFELDISLLVLFWIALLIPLIFSIRKDYRYIYEFVSDGNTFKLKYLKINKSSNTEGLLSNLNVKLLNKSSRSGSRCELKVSFENLNFFIREQNDWTLDNMKTLFLFIKKSKNEEIDEWEKFNLGRLDDKWNRLKKEEAKT